MITYRKEQFIDDSMTFKAEALTALRRFKEATKGSNDMGLRYQAIRRLVGELAQVYGMSEVPESVLPNPNQITMSTISLLHKFASARGIGRTSTDSFLECQRWAVNFFRKVYPSAFEKLVFHSDGYFSKPRNVIEPPVAAQPAEDPVETRTVNALRTTNGNVKAAAELIGVSASTIRRRVARYNINLETIRNAA